MRTIVSNDEKARITALDMQAERERKREDAIERQRNREEQVRIAEEAQIRRSERNAGTLYERVERAKQRLEGMPAGAFVSLLEQLSDSEREVYLLAEAYGKNRQDLLRRFPRPRKKTVTEYLQAVEAVDDATTEVPVVEDVPPSPKLKRVSAKSPAAEAGTQEA
jgi:hypothetical protein